MAGGEEEVIIDFIANVAPAIAEVSALTQTVEELGIATDQAKDAFGRFDTGAAEMAAMLTALHTEIDDVKLSEEELIAISRGLELPAEYLRKIGISAGEAAAGVDTMNKAIEQTGLNAVEATTAADAGLASWRASITKTQADLLALAAVVDVANGDISRTRAQAMLSGAALTAFNAATVKAAAGADDAARGINNMGNAARFGIGWFRMTATAWHWLLAGAAEYLAVAIPGMIAMAGWLADWVQGAQNVQQHMTALYGATEATAAMFHRTVGTVLGLGHALQTAQNAANPQVYSALGSAILIMREHMVGLAQVGLQVGNTFDTFAAKLVYDFSKAGGAGQQLDAFLKYMYSDFLQFGQILGNIGNSIAAFASQMPGLALVLLSVLNAVTGVIRSVLDFSLALQRMHIPILTAIMGFEEFNRWGSLLVSGLGKIGLATAEVSGGFLSLGRARGVFMSLVSAIPVAIARITQALGTWIASMGQAGSGINRLGVNIAGFGSDVEEGVASLSFFQAALIALGVAGIGFMIYKLSTAKTQLQTFADTMEQTINTVSNAKVITVLANDMGKLQAATAQATSVTKSLNSEIKNTGAAAKYVGGMVNYEKTNIDSGNAALRQMQQQTANVAQGATYLANTYHTSLAGAIQLATAAGVHLVNNITGQSQAAAILRDRIASLVAGYMAMSAPLNVVGADMTALAIQSGLAATKVAQLNQAWDQFMQNLTSGTNAMSQLQESLQNIGHVAADTANHLSSTTGGMVLSTKQFADALTHYTGMGAAAWQNFNQAVGTSGQQMMDFLRTAGAEGAITGHQFSMAALDMAKSLVPLAAHSRTAQAELLGLVQQADPNIKTFAQLRAAVDKAGIGTKNLSGIVNEATIKMGDMAAVAQQLGNVLNQDIINAMTKAEFATSGVSQATLKYTQDLRDNTQGTSAGQADRAALIHAFELAGESAKHAAELVKLLTDQINAVHSKTVAVNVNTYYHSIGSPGQGTTGAGSGGVGHRVQQGSTGGIMIGLGSGPPHPTYVNVVHVHVGGSVAAEHDLARTVQRVLLERTFSNPTAGVTWPARRT